MTALGCETDVLDFHSIRFGADFLKVGFELGVVGDAIIVANIEPEGFFGRRDLRLRAKSERGEEEAGGGLAWG